MHVPDEIAQQAPTLPTSVLKSTKTRGPTRGELVERSIIPVCAQDSVVLAPSTMSSTTRANLRAFVDECCRGEHRLWSVLGGLRRTGWVDTDGLEG